MSATETRSEPRHMSLEPATLRALGMDGMTDDLVHAGNVAAHLYRLAYGNGDGLTGINLGWADQEHSTAFLAGIVDDIDEWVADEDITDLEEAWDDQRHEFCDQAVPVYNHERIMAAMDLQAAVSDIGLLDSSGEVGLPEFCGVALYEEAETIGSALVLAVIKARAELVEEAEEAAAEAIEDAEFVELEALYEKAATEALSPEEVARVAELEAKQGLSGS